jgi:hypothetical protein
MEEYSKTEEEELLRLKAGYVQHTSPIQPHTALFLSVLIQMENDAKSIYPINFTRKRLNLLAKHTSLSEPEAVARAQPINKHEKAFISRA